MAEVVDKIIDSLENNLESWEVDWMYDPIGGEGRWVRVLHHPIGIKLREDGVEKTTWLNMYIDDGSVFYNSFHEGEIEKLHEAYRRAVKRITEGEKIRLKEHNDKLRLKLMEMVKGL